MLSIETLTMNPTIDLSSRVEHVVAERKLRCEEPRMEPGGGGINVSRAIRKLGGESTAFYAAGGLTARLLHNLLEDEDVGHRALPVEGMTRQSFSFLEQASGRQFRFSMPGPRLEGKEWKGILESVSGTEQGPGYFVASGGLPPGVPADFYARAALAVRNRGRQVIVDTSGPALREAAEAGVFLLKPNMRELRELTGQNIEGEAELEEAVGRIIQMGRSHAVVVSLGAAGALLATGDGCERLRSPTVPIQSKVGAGDSMVGGIVLALARGKALRDAVVFGVAAGAAAVMTPGTELCRREDADRLYERMTSYG